MKYSLKLLFLLFVPLLCEGGSRVQITMPSSKSVKTREKLRITCHFTAESLTKMSLFHGDTETIAAYIVAEGQFKLQTSDGVALEIGPGTTVKGGSLTFVISRVTCSDFTWYVCRGTVPLSTVDSQNITLRVYPEVGPIIAASESTITLYQRSTFTCKGTVGKEGPFSVEWYRRTISPFTHIEAGPATVIYQNQCSRTVSSTISYIVFDLDKPTLILCCRIKAGGHFSDDITFFAVPGAGCALKVNAIMVLMVPFIASRFLLF